MRLSRPKRPLSASCGRELSQQYTFADASCPHYMDMIAETDEWQTGLPSARCICPSVAESPRNRQMGRSPDDYDGNHEPSSLLAELKSTALAGHKQHVANIHRSYGRDIGLVSKRGTNKLRYAPNDNLLKTLLLANVRGPDGTLRISSETVRPLWLCDWRQTGRSVLPPEQFDKKAFQANARRLEGRLGSLGMLRRLSDGCAYVENPYRQATHE